MNNHDNPVFVLLLIIGLIALLFWTTSKHERALEKRVDALEQAAEEQKRP